MNRPIVGVGLRSKHFPYLENRPKTGVDWFECLAENHMYSEGRPKEILEIIRQDYEVGCHGVSLNIGSAEGVNLSYVKKLKTFIDFVKPCLVSDHLSWIGLKRKAHFHELLPLPFNEEALAIVSQNVHIVQDILAQEICLENISYYFSYENSSMLEYEFFNALMERTGCKMLLDLNNLYINAFNHGYDAIHYLDNLNLKGVRQVHLAGHLVADGFLFDNHGSKVPTDVWHLLNYVKSNLIQTRYLIEWDENVPEFSTLESQVSIAKNHLARTMELQL